MIRLVIRTIIRYLLRELEPRHTLRMMWRIVWRMIRLLIPRLSAPHLAENALPVRLFAGGQSIFLTFRRRFVAHFAPGSAASFFRFSHQQGVRRLALATRVRWPCPAVPARRATGQNESRHAAAYAVGSQNKCRFGTCSVPACHFFTCTGPHSGNISLIESGFAARWAPQGPAGP